MLRCFDTKKLIGNIVKEIKNESWTSLICISDLYFQLLMFISPSALSTSPTPPSSSLLSLYRRSIIEASSLLSSNLFAQTHTLAAARVLRLHCPVISYLVLSWLGLADFPSLSLM